MKLLTLSSLALLALFAVGFASAVTGSEKKEEMNGTTPQLEKALFAGGCFWCMEKPFETLSGVISATSGYAGGSSLNPTYENYGKGGHTEVVQILYDPQKVSYGRLLDTFWHQIDPTDAGGQFVDRGHEYISAIFVYNDAQRRLAQASKERLEASNILKKPVVTEILDAPTFWPAEEYHQDYYKNNPIRYKYYRSRSGRDDYLQKAWEGVSLDLAGEAPKVARDLKKELTALQYHVTQEAGTEPAFDNPYWDNKRAGIYVDIVSGEVLFSSIDKYDSGTGWPSFTKPLVKDNITEREDRGLFSSRTEVRSSTGNSHLGHVFPDGPPPTGLRYCMNSAALRFIPVDQLAASGYGEWGEIFK